MRAYLTIHHKIQEIIAMVALVISLIIAIVAAVTIKGPVPIHWDAAGNVDKYGSSFGFLLFPAIMLPTSLIMMVCTHLLPINCWNFPVKPKPGREPLIYRDSAYLVTLYNLEIGLFTLAATVGTVMGKDKVVSISAMALIVAMVITMIPIFIMCKRHNR